MDLKKNAPKGEFLAYINKEEAALLKKHGGSGKLVNGIPSFIGFDAGTIGTDGKQGGKGSNSGLSGGYQGGTLDGMGDADRDGPTTKNPYDKGKVKNKEIRDEQKFSYNKQFYDKGKIGPSHSRKSLRQRQKIQNVINYINYQTKQNKAKLDAGVFKVLDDYEGTFNDLSYADRVALARSSALSFQDPNLALAGGKKGYSQKTINDILSGKRQNIDFAVPSNFPSTIGMVTNKLGDVFGGPVTKEKLDELFDKGVELDKLDPTKETTFDLMKQYEPDRYEKFFGGGGGDGGNNQPIIPINYNTGAAEGPDYDGTNKFTYDENAFGPGGDSADVTRASYIFNKGGRVPAMEGGIMGTRARRAMGGIMNRVDQRQGYFLGKIVKGIGKAVSGVAKAAGKVLKSDVGKMALLYAGGSYLSGMGPFFGGLPGAGKGAQLFNTLKNSKLATGIMGLKDKYDSFGKLGKIATMGGIGFGLSMIPGLNKPKPNEDTYADRGGSLIDPITGQPAKPAEMRASLNDALNNAGGDPDKIKQIQDAYAFLPPDERLGTFSPYRTYGVKDGGRIGYSLGNLVEGSSVVQPASGLAIKLNRPVKSGDPVGSYYPDPSKMKTASPMPSSGMGGMLSKLINNNPQLFKNVSGQNSNNYRFNTGENLAQVTRESYDFIDENMNGIDDREEMIMANGGRIGFNTGSIVPPVEMPDPMERMLKNMTPEERAKFQMMLKINAARMPEYKPDPNAIPPVEMPTYPRTNRAEGGLMDLGGMEKDYRAEGGFVPIGEYEKKDDVPARLSVNEFVFTADAVRGAGQGDIDKGAEIMENMMENLENGGTVSEESQGNKGAQQMFETSQRLGEVV